MLLPYFSSLSCLLPFILSLLLWKQLLNENKWLLIHLAVCALVEVSCVALALKTTPNTHIYAIYTPVEFYLLARALGATNKTANLNKAVLPFTLLVVLLSAVEFFKLTGFRAMTSLSTALEFLILAGFALHSFHRIMLEQTDRYLFSSPRFWLAAGVLLYTCGSLFSFLARYYFFIAGSKFPVEFFVIHSLLNFSFQILLTQTVLCYRKATPFGLS